MFLSFQTQGQADSACNAMFVSTDKIENIVSNIKFQMFRHQIVLLKRLSVCFETLFSLLANLPNISQRTFHKHFLVITSKTMFFKQVSNLRCS